MKNTSLNKWLAVSAGLALAMLATRMGHFGNAVRLPDASLAIFFLGGLLLAGQGKARNSITLGALGALAAGIDWYVTQKLGVSSYCITPAYGFLMLTYATTFAIGNFAHGRSFASQFFIALAAMALAFFTSNLSFWALAPYFDGMSVVEYYSKVVPRYAASYISTGMFYTTVVMGAMYLHAVQREHKLAMWPNNDG